LSTTLNPWLPLFRDPPSELELTPLAVVAGAIPVGLQGSLYRNGAARWGRGTDRAGHWFDGDGALLAVHFREGQAEATYRFVQTPFVRHEDQEKRLIYGNYGRRGRGFKNPANTSVIALGDTLWALCEAGSPWALDPYTLATLGEIKTFPAAYGAHPKWDPQTGWWWNVGVNYGIPTWLHLYCHDAWGRLLHHRRFRLPYATLIHDLVLIPPFLVVLIPPLQGDLWAVLSGQQCFSQACRWIPKLGSQWWVMDLESLRIHQKISGDPCFAWHYARARHDGQHLTLEGCFYPDFESNTYLAEVITGQITTDPHGFFGEITLTLGQPHTGSPTVILDRTCDFAVVGAGATYVNVHRQGSRLAPDLFTGIGRWDGQTWQETPWPAGIYPSEAVVVDPWLLTVVYHAPCHRSEVWILDAHDLSRDPLCRLALPQPIPPSFHGCFVRG